MTNANERHKEVSFESDRMLDGSDRFHGDVPVSTQVQYVPGSPNHAPDLNTHQSSCYYGNEPRPCAPPSTPNYDDMRTSGHVTLPRAGVPTYSSHLHNKHVRQRSEYLNSVLLAERINPPSEHPTNARHNVHFPCDKCNRVQNSENCACRNEPSLFEYPNTDLYKDYSGHGPDMNLKRGHCKCSDKRRARGQDESGEFTDDTGSTTSSGERRSRVKVKVYLPVAGIEQLEWQPTLTPVLSPDVNTFDFPPQSPRYSDRLSAHGLSAQSAAPRVTAIEKQPVRLAGATENDKTTSNRESFSRSSTKSSYRKIDLKPAIVENVPYDYDYTLNKNAEVVPIASVPVANAKESSESSVGNSQQSIATGAHKTNSVPGSNPPVIASVCSIRRERPLTPSEWTNRKSNHIV